MNKYIVEFIGTFFLVLTIGCNVLGQNVMAPLAIGGVLVAVIFAGGYISGAHYNPAVTLAVFLRGRCTSKNAAFYVIAQLLAAALASVTAKFLVPVKVVATAAAAAPVPAFAWSAPVFIAEFLFTFALCYVILNVATAKGTSSNSFYGLAIGLTVMVGAFTVGGISGGVFNPAVAVGLVIMNLSVAPPTLVILANLTGAALAAIVFHIIDPDPDVK